MSHIFISYSRKDIDFAQKIVDALAANELDTWIDWKSIPKGEDWEQEIFRGIEGADAFLFLISPHSVASEMCNKEIAHAIENGKRVLPIFIANVDDREINAVTERFFDKEQGKEISRRNYIKCRDGRDNFIQATEEIRTTIHIDYEWLKYHTKLQSKALDWERRKDQKDVSGLLRGKELREAEEQLAEVKGQEDAQPTKIQREYVLASRRNEEHIRRRNTVVTSGITVVMFVLATIAWFQRNEAVEQKDAARAGQLSLQSASARLEKNIDLALLLGVEAANASNTFDAQNALLLGLEWAPRLRTFLPEPSIYSAFSPEGQLMASIGINEGAVSLWSLDRSDPFTLLSTFSIEGQNPRRLSFGSNGTTLAITTGSDIELWDVSVPETPSFMASIKHDPYDLPSISFDPTRSILAVGHREGQLDLYDVADPHNPELISSVTLALDGETFFHLNQIAYSPNGQVLAASLDEWIVLVDASNAAAPEKISQVSTTHYGASNMSINSDGKLLVLADDGGDMNLIDISNPLLPNLVRDSFGGSDNYGGEGAGGITAVFSSQDPNVLASVGCTDIEMGVVGVCLASDVFLWEISPFRDPDLFSDPLGGHHGNLHEIAFQPGKEFLAAIDSDARLLYWDVSDEDVLPSFATLFRVHDASISCLAVSSDNRLFASGDELGTINLWNISEPHNPEVLSKIFVDAPPSHLTISPAENYLAVVSGRKFALWNISSLAKPALLVEVSDEHAVDIMDLVFSRKETEFYSISQDGVINSWSISNSSAHLTQRMTIDRFPEISAIAMSPDGAILALGHENGSLSLWKTPDLSLLKWFDDPYSSDYGDAVNGIVFSVDGKSLIASYEFMNGVYFWDITRTVAVQQPQGALEGSQPGVSPGMFGITMAAKAGLLATSGCSEETGEGDCSDIEVRLWDFSATSSPRLLGNPLPGLGIKMVMSPNGDLLISGRSDGAIVFWHLDAAYWVKTACQIVARNFTQAEWTQYFPGEEYRLTCAQWPAGQ